MLNLYRKLSANGVLGINKRNADYTLIYNKRELYPQVDDKLLTKKLAIEVGISVPELYGVVKTPQQTKNLEKIIGNHSDFVVKPSRGSGGQGVLVISGKMKHKDLFRKISGTAISMEDLRFHVQNILSGMYSLGGQPDAAMIEYRVRFDPVFDHISYLGVPDIRVITFLGVPVMAMVRLPTRFSDGKANLHQGAVGAGINITSGKTICAVIKNQVIDEHPDTGHSILDVQIPNWRSLLELSSKCYNLTGLGYQGVDIVLDKELGPLILELNARPGLNIQIANHCGLLPRLKLVEKHFSTLNDVNSRVNFAIEEMGRL